MISTQSFKSHQTAQRQKRDLLHKIAGRLLFILFLAALVIEMSFADITLISTRAKFGWCMWGGILGLNIGVLLSEVSKFKRLS